jgi:hypothetical protein
MSAEAIIPFFKNGPRVMLHVACNDGDSGMFEAKAGAVEVQFGRDLYDRLSFSPNYFDWSPAFHVDHDKKMLRFAGRPIPFIAYGEHVGNWCWNAYKISREDAAELITWAKFRKWFSLDEAPHDLWEAYHQPRSTGVRDTGFAGKADKHQPPSTGVGVP